MSNVGFSHVLINNLLFAKPRSEKANRFKGTNFSNSDYLPTNSYHLAGKLSKANERCNKIISLIVLHCPLQDLTRTRIRITLTLLKRQNRPLQQTVVNRDLQK